MTFSCLFASLESEGVSVVFFFFFFRAEMQKRLHHDEDYPCEVVGSWNTWYGEQDQAGTEQLPFDLIIVHLGLKCNQVFFFFLFSEQIFATCQFDQFGRRSSES